MQPAELCQVSQGNQTQTDHRRLLHCSTAAVIIVLQSPAGFEGSFAVTCAGSASAPDAARRGLSEQPAASVPTSRSGEERRLSTCDV
jgi:hypothetical protein